MLLTKQMLTKVISLRIALFLVLPHEDVSQNTALAQFASENLSNQLYIILLGNMPFHKKKLSVNVTSVNIVYFSRLD
jgi:hypothetical protein